MVLLTALVVWSFSAFADIPGEPCNVPPPPACNCGPGDAGAGYSCTPSGPGCSPSNQSTDLGGSILTWKCGANSCAGVPSCVPQPTRVTRTEGCPAGQIGQRVFRQTFNTGNCSYNAEELWQNNCVSDCTQYGDGPGDTDGNNFDCRLPYQTAGTMVTLDYNAAPGRDYNSLLQQYTKGGGDMDDHPNDVIYGWTANGIFTCNGGGDRGSWDGSAVGYCGVAYQNCSYYSCCVRSHTDYWPCECNHRECNCRMENSCSTDINGVEHCTPVRVCDTCHDMCTCSNWVCDEMSSGKHNHCSSCSQSIPGAYISKNETPACREDYCIQGAASMRGADPHFQFAANALSFIEYDGRLKSVETGGLPHPFGNGASLSGICKIDREYDAFINTSGGGLANIKSACSGASFALCAGAGPAPPVPVGQYTSLVCKDPSRYEPPILPPTSAMCGSTTVSLCGQPVSLPARQEFEMYTAYAYGVSRTYRCTHTGFQQMGADSGTCQVPCENKRATVCGQEMALPSSIPGQTQILTMEGRSETFMCQNDGTFAQQSATGVCPAGPCDICPRGTTPSWSQDGGGFHVSCIQNDAASGGVNRFVEVAHCPVGTNPQNFKPDDGNKTPTGSIWACNATVRPVDFGTNNSCQPEGFGGMYTVNANGGCRHSNRLTAGCSCPADYTGYAIDEFQYFPGGECAGTGYYGEGGCGITKYACLKDSIKPILQSADIPAAQKQPFGGYYTKNLDGTCRYSNGVTGSCSCSSGFNAFTIDHFANPGCVGGIYADAGGPNERTTNCGIQSYVCVNTASTVDSKFGGMYLVNINSSIAQGSCPSGYGNPLAGNRCACPAGYDASSVDDFYNAGCEFGFYSDGSISRDCGIMQYLCTKN